MANVTLDQNKLYYTAAEISEVLGVSMPSAYRIIHNLNDELKSMGYITVAGKISRAYFNKKIYAAEIA